MRPVNNKHYSWFGIFALVSPSVSLPLRQRARNLRPSPIRVGFIRRQRVVLPGQHVKGRKPVTAFAARARARKASLARARAQSMARETALTILPRYKFDDLGALVPDLHAEAAVIYDPETNQVLWEQNSQTQRSIASITKVMTATVFLENDPNISEMVTIARSDVFQASTTRLKMNDQVTTDDLLHLMLIASDNAAARAPARVSPYGSVGFVQRMNEKASELGLEMTNYADPSGLLSDNVSSAYDMARLITLASNDERIASVMRMPEHALYREAPGDYIPFDRSSTRSPDIDVRAAKTGFISKSGYCLATPASRCRRAGSRWRLSCWARGRMRGASRDTQSVSVALVEGVNGPGLGRVAGAVAVAPDPVAIRRNPAASRPHRAGASQSHPQTPSPDEARAGCRALQIAPADVARAYSVSPVARGKRRDARAVVVGAEGAGEGREWPLAAAPAADEAPLGARRDHREVRFPPAEGAVPMCSTRRRRGGRRGRRVRGSQRGQVGARRERL
jgi:hypothetical protein